jgi:hypothetical protein
MSSMSRGWSLMKQSWSVLRLDKELMLFPVLSSIACFLVLASFALPFIVSPELRNTAMQVVHEAQPDRQAEPAAGAPAAPAVDPDPQQQLTRRVVAGILGFSFYLVNYFVIVFFNTALVACAVKRFSGGDPTVGYGLREAVSRLPQILAWAFLAATVGYILRLIEERVSLVGKIVVGLIGLAWTVATYMVVPVLAVERVGPFRAVSRSAELLTKSWGTALVGNLSLGLAGFVLSLPGILLIVAAPIAGVATESLVLAVVLGVIGIVYLMVFSIVTSTLRQILLAGVYLYAAGGHAPAGLSEEVVRSAFRPKS